MSDSVYPDLIHKWNHQFSILSIVSFPESQLLFAGTQDSKILVFDLPTYRCIHTITLGNTAETHTRSSVLCLTRSENEEFLFSAGADSLVRIWSVSRDSAPFIEEVATVYSITDIGDIFSINYLDSMQTLIIGCQNASLLYVDDLFCRLNASNSSTTISSLSRLPHKRYNKFFDSSGPVASFQTKDTYVPNESDKPLDLSNEFKTGILEIPSENIINYAHNGFIYSICTFDNSHGASLNIQTDYPEYNKEYIVTAGGDGITKIWSLNQSEDRRVTRLVLEVDDLDNEESVLSQSIEFPFLYCGLSDGIVKIWDITTKQLISTLHTPDTSDVISLSVYKDHIFAINESGSTIFYENRMVHWNLNQGKMLSSEIFTRSSKNENRAINLLTGGNDGSLTLWDLTELIKYDKSNSPQENALVHSAGSSLARRKSWVSYHSASINIEDMIHTIRDLVAFRSVSQSHDTSEQMASRRCAAYLQQLFMNFGATKTQLLPVEDGMNPVVFAIFTGNAPASEKKRILWYGHYDVIPCGDTRLWKTDPFAMVCDNGYMRGRGVSDNKGPLVAAIYSVATLFQNGELNNDVVFLVEGNEETGSQGLPLTCTQNSDLISSPIDWILFSNSSWIDQVHPCLNYGLRGVINAEVTVKGDQPDLHSGVNGGVYREPAADLVNIISRLQDEQGKITIPDFYASLEPLNDTEINEFEKIIEISDLEDTKTLQELITNWTKPSLSITTMDTSGPKNITVIPKQATIGLSIRIVPNQNTTHIKESLISYIQELFAKLNTNNHLEIKIVNEAEAWLGDPSNHAYNVLKEELAKAWGIEPLCVREGGSIPCVRTLEKIFGTSAVQIPCGQSTDNAHLDNENLCIRNCSQLAKVLYNVFNRL